MIRFGFILEADGVNMFFFYFGYCGFFLFCDLFWFKGGGILIR